MSALRARLAALCDQITRHADMEQAIRDAGAGPQLDELLGAIRDGAVPVPAPEPDRLTALLDEIEEACARDGLAGVTSRVKQFTGLAPGLRGGQAEPPVWVCPLQRCARVVFDDEAVTDPLCAAGGNVPMLTKRVL